MSSFLKYKNKNTIFHKIDARIKLIFLIVILVSIFLPYGSLYNQLTIDGIIFIVTILMSILSKSSFSSVIKSLKALWVMILFILIVNMFFTNDTTSQVLFTLFNKDIRIAPLLKVLLIVLRIAMVLMLTNIFSSTTKPMDITYALEFYLSPLKLLHVPVSSFSMAISLSLRFIPTFSMQAKRIKDAQASRGVDYKNGKLKDKIKVLISMLVPLFVSAFLKSEQLANAMESKGYNPSAKRSKYQIYKFSFKDFLTIILMLIFLTPSILECIYKFDIYKFFNVSLPPL